MKGITLIAAGIVATASGCASTSSPTTAGTSATAARPIESAGPSSYFDDQYDTQKVARINAIARSRGVDVKWVNYPQRKPSSGAAPAAQPTGT